MYVTESGINSRKMHLCRIFQKADGDINYQTLVKFRKNSNIAIALKYCFN